MSFLSGIFQRPIVAAAAVSAASISIDLRDKLPTSKSLDTSSTFEQSNSHAPHSLQETKSSWVSNTSVSKLANLSFVTRIRIPTPNIAFPVPSTGSYFPPKTVCSALLSSYQSAEPWKLGRPIAYTQYVSPPNSSPDVPYRWHLPKLKDVDLSSDCSLVKSRTVVVLLGWLGSRQKHLNKYAEWYTSMGYHVITFTFPMADLISYQVAGKTEQHVESLVNHLTDWLEEEHGKNLVFHTFSNTGWLTYGVILEKLQKGDPSLIGRIKGCIVDSAPVAASDPQVWASGFSAAFLKKHSVATKGMMTNETSVNVSLGSHNVAEAKPALTETALLLVLEKFFEVVLNLPTINRRLSDVMGLLKSRQPSCPQLYIYSSADRVIPANSVESFIEEQRRSGHEVRACNFVSTPHVDHFRNDPKLYTSQLTNFLEDSVLACCKHSS